MEVVIAEVLPHVKSCNIYGRVTRDFDTLKEIKVKKESCIFNFEKESISLEFPSGVSLLPDSASGYKFENGAIILRVQTDDKTTLLSNVLSELVDELEDFNPFKKSFIHFSPKDDVRITCRYCSTELSKSMKFRRTCQLPSVDWEHASEDWFCCLEKPVKETLKPGSLQPALDEAFYAELYYLINNANLVDGVDKSKKLVHCYECNYTVGKFLGSCAKFWKHSIKWIDSKNEKLYDESENESLVSLVDNIDRDNFGVNCRLVLEKPSSPKEFLFMVTMDTDMKLLMTKNIFFGNKYDYGCNEKGEEIDKTKSGNSISIKKLCLNEEGENTKSGQNEIIKLHKNKAIKLLFSHKIGEDAETGSWIDDVNVHILSCGDRFFDTILNSLKISNSLLPIHSSKVDDLLVSYLLR